MKNSLKKLPKSSASVIDLFCPSCFYILGTSRLSGFTNKQNWYLAHAHSNFHFIKAQKKQTDIHPSNKSIILPRTRLIILHWILKMRKRHPKHIKKKKIIFFIKQIKCNWGCQNVKIIFLNLISLYKAAFNILSLSQDVIKTKYIFFREDWKQFSTPSRCWGNKRKLYIAQRLTLS